ncbi:MAG: histidine phosphatase family protein [Tissierellia bacterium]|nr:histidine phosphatase family protein [Tissierellia bacterium]
MLYIVRHGVTEYNAKRMFQGTLDIPLNEEGIAAAELVAHNLKDVDIDRIYTSDLKRARTTAEIIGAKKNLVPMIDPRLREIHMGKWQGKVKFHIEQEPDYIQFREQPHLYAPQHGESFHELIERIESFQREICPEENTVVVTHGLVILTWLNLLEGKELVELYHRDFIENCEVIAVDMKTNHIQRNVFHLDPVGVWAIEKDK